MSRGRNTIIRHGSGNVFADLGFPDPDTHLLKVRLISRLIEIIDERQLTQMQAAHMMGISQPDVSRLLKGQFRDVSLERIMRMLVKLGYQGDIVVIPNAGAAPEATTHFSLNRPQQ